MEWTNDDMTGFGCSAARAIVARRATRTGGVFVSEGAESVQSEVTYRLKLAMQCSFPITMRRIFALIHHLPSTSR